ncbi:MAG: hypothetical protein KGP14_01275 [Betaproteobacteria bacterium]|nr:hypothetical protein [Betaproteobacteria bacterium]
MFVVFGGFFKLHDPNIDWSATVTTGYREHAGKQRPFSYIRPIKRDYPAWNSD